MDIIEIVDISIVIIGSGLITFGVCGISGLIKSHKSCKPEGEDE